MHEPTDSGAKNNHVRQNSELTMYTSVWSGLSVDVVCDGAVGGVERNPEVTTRGQQLLFPLPVQDLARLHPASALSGLY
jgi:hypothetical protein